MISNKNELQAAKHEISLYNRLVRSFLSRIKKTGSCWLWDGAKIAKEFDYGLTRVDGKIIPAHRVSFMIHKGKIPDGLFVLHTCDTPLCVNPKHLYAGTHQKNMADKGTRRRHWGESVASSKLTVEDVKKVMKLHSDGYGSTYIAKQVGCSACNISQITTGRSWYHLTGLSKKAGKPRVNRVSRIRNKERIVPISKKCPPILY